MGIFNHTIRPIKALNRYKINPENINLYNKYKVDMSIRELSEGTIGGYEGDLYSWFFYIYENQGNKSIVDIGEDDIEEFIYFCKSQGNNTRRIKRRVAAISAMYKYLRRKKLVTLNPVEFISRPRKDVDVIVQTFLTESQILQMKKKLKEYGSLQLAVYALLSLSTMARVNAICNISWSQIDFENRMISEVIEKEGKVVTLYFNHEVCDLMVKLKKLRASREIDDKGWLFITKYSGVYSKANKSSLQSWAKKIGAMINVPSLHAHDFRHSGAQLLKINGCPIETISELLNHETIDVTVKHYLRQDKILMKQLKDKYDLAGGGFDCQ